MVYGTTLERWHTVKGIGSSNLPPSAKIKTASNSAVLCYNRRNHRLRVHISLCNNTKSFDTSVDELLK